MHHRPRSTQSPLRRDSAGARRRLRPILLTFGLAALAGAAGCGGGGGGGGSSSGGLPVGTGPLISQPNNDTKSTLGNSPWTVHTETKAADAKKWTVLVYINGANDLGSGVGNFDITNVLQMEKVGSSNDVNIVVQWQAMSGADGYGDYSTAAWSGARRYYITRNTGDTNANISSPLISENSTVDTGDWQSLQDFVQWGVQAFPATHYALIVWDHGAGWRAVTRKIASTKGATTRAASAGASSPTTRGVSFNYHTGAFIRTDQIPEGIDISNLSAQKFDVVSFDCSLMQMVEVAYEISNPGSAAPSGYVAPTYIQASEESPPGAGLPYDLMLQDMVNNPTEDPLTFAKDICDQTINEYGTTSDSTQSVIASAQMPSLINSLNSLGTALTAAQGSWGSQIALAQNNAEAYASGEEAGANYWYWDYHDLVDFLNLLTNASNTSTYVNNGGVLSAAQAAKTAASNAIVYNRNGGLHPNSHGLTVWIPSPADFTTAETQQANTDNSFSNNYGPTDQLYTQLSIASAAPNWLNFLQTGPSTYTPYTSPGTYGQQ